MVAIPPYVTPGNPVQGVWGNQVVDALTAMDTSLSAAVLIGEMKIWPGDVAPTNFLFCRGQLISRATYSALYAVIGTKFGVGDGSTTFGLPNMQGMTPVGLNTGTAPGIVGGAFTGVVGNVMGTTTAILPLHTHGGGSHTHAVNIWSQGMDRDHSHYVSANTSDVSAYHQHDLGGLGVYVRQNIGAPAFYLHVTSGGGFDLASDLPNGASVITGASGSHVHNFSAWSGGSNQSHLHAVNGVTDASQLTTGESGQNSTNGNIQPSMIVNFIIKAT